MAPTWVKIDIRPSQVEQPRNLIKHCYYDRLFFLLLQLLPDLCDFLQMGLPGILLIQMEHPVRRSRGALFSPNRVHQVLWEGNERGLFR